MKSTNQVPHGRAEWHQPPVNRPLNNFQHLHFCEAVSCNVSDKLLQEHTCGAATVTVKRASSSAFFIFPQCQCRRAFSGRMHAEREPFQTADTSTSAARQSLQTWQGHGSELERAAEQRRSWCLMFRLLQPYWAAALLFFFSPFDWTISSALILDFHIARGLP